VAINGKDGDISIAAHDINHGEPLAIRRDGDVRWRARQGLRFVEHATLAVAKEDGDRLAWGVGRVPDVPRSFGYRPLRWGGLRQGDQRAVQTHIVLHPGCFIARFGKSSSDCNLIRVDLLFCLAWFRDIRVVGITSDKCPLRSGKLFRPGWSPVEIRRRRRGDRPTLRQWVHGAGHELCVHIELT
jgi:hypothetical protein